MVDTAPEIGWIKSNGLALRFLGWGAEDAPAIVMLHGLRSYAYTWAPIAETLMRDWRVIALDQRGRGESDWDPQGNYSTQAYVDDLAALVDHLKLGRFVLLGHSMGGTNGIIYAASHPDRVTALVIEDMGPGASYSSLGSERIKRELQETPLSFSTWDEAAAFWRKIRPDVSEEAIRSRVKHSLKEGVDGRVTWRYDAEGIAHARLNSTPVDLWSSVVALSMPTLLIRGTRSDLLTPEIADQMCLRNPRVSRKDVTGSHYVHDDNLPDFNSALRTFLLEIEELL